MVTAESFYLIVHEGPSPGQEIELTEEEHLIGRDPSSPTAITIQSPGVSRQHARIFQREGRWHIEDLNSSNGTFLNEQTVVGEPQPLSPGDLIGLGRSVKLEYQGPPVPAAAETVADVPLERVPGSENLAATVAMDEKLTDGRAFQPQLTVTVAGAAPASYDLSRDTT
ncbi:MAG: FHA domain-containing protein, partial [Anaerolineales bacterium]|nr:FHA domain-containing protein [Anaerolineales bacterium]